MRGLRLSAAGGFRRAALVPIWDRVFPADSLPGKVVGRETRRKFLGSLRLRPVFRDSLHLPCRKSKDANSGQNLLFFGENTKNSLQDSLQQGIHSCSSAIRMHARVRHIMPPIPALSLFMTKP
jgi:hypothetical protein